MNTKLLRGVPWWLAAVLVLLFGLSLTFVNTNDYTPDTKPVEIVLSVILQVIPITLLYISIGVLVMADRQRRSQGQISKRLAKLIYWIPRIAGIFISLFVAMFALDVLGMEGSVWEKIGAFLIHAAPAIAMGIVLAVAWRQDKVGFWAFLIAAIFFLRFWVGDPLEQFGMVLLFSGPMAVIAMMFWANWKWKKELHPTETAA